MEATDARTPANPGGRKVKHRLLASKSKIASDGHALRKALESPPPPGQPAPGLAHAIDSLSKELATLHADVLRETGGGAKGKQARQLAAQTIADARGSLAKLRAASTAQDQASAVKLIGEGLNLLDDAKRASRKAGKLIGGSWPI
jgi:hypothetical protein